MQAPVSDRPAIWSLGFRPFFLAAGASASVLVLVWVVVYVRGAALPVYYGNVLWHGHEMIFGYTAAVIAGFLLTAVKNWSGRQTATGGVLAGLAVLWLAGRLLPFAGDRVPAGLIAVVDLAFLPALFLSLLAALRAPEQRANKRLLLILVALTAANAMVHLQQLGLTRNSAQPGLRFAVYLIVVLVTVIAGRVVPFFAERALPGFRARQRPWLDRTVISLTVLSAVLLPWWEGGHWLTFLCLLAGLAHLVRLSAWHDRRIWRVPILWVLYVGYGWVGVGYIIAGATQFRSTAIGFPALHAFTVGAIGILTMGMMARVALGHTGRSMQAPRLIVLAFALLVLAALVRVLVPILAPGWYVDAIIASGVVWSLAFALFVLSYAPILTRPRIDGQPG